MRLTRLAVLAASALLATPTMAAAQATVPTTEFEVPWGRDGRPRDPSVAPNGDIFFVGQAASYVARLNPRNGEFKKYEIDPGARPHTCNVDAKGMVWFTGNANGTMNRLDPATGKIDTYTIPDGVRDPHTTVFDKKGNIWFTAQNSNFVGYFDVTTTQFRLMKMPRERARPYGIIIDSKGRPYFNLFGTNLVGTIDPATFELKTYPVGDSATLNRRIGVTSDDKIYYTDYRNGRVGRLDPATGQSKDWLLPSGRGSLPYAMTVDDQDRIWVAETGVQPNKLVGFDPKSEKFFSITAFKGERNTVRHMVFDKKTKLIWFGSDAGFIGKADVAGIKVAM